MQMINVLKRLAELDEKNPNVITPPGVIKESIVSECGEMTGAMPSTVANTPASINIVAANGPELSGMLRDIMSLAGMNKPAVSAAPMVGDVDLTHAPTNMRSMIDRLNPEVDEEVDGAEYDTTPADPTEHGDFDAEEFAHQENQPGQGNRMDGTAPKAFPGLDETVNKLFADYNAFVAESAPSAGLTKAEKSAVVKKAKAGKDIGKPGKGFAKVEKAAAKSGAKDPKAVAAAAMWKGQAAKKKIKESMGREDKALIQQFASGAIDREEFISKMEQLTSTDASMNQGDEENQMTEGSGYPHTIHTQINNPVWLAYERGDMDDTGVDIESIPEYIDVEAEYAVSGENRPATWDDPAEYVEIEIGDVHDTATKEKITDKLDDAAYAEIEAAIQEEIDNYEPDYDPPEPDYDDRY